MQAILYVAHGTRLEAGVEEAKTFVQHHMDLVNIPIQVMSFIDLAIPTIDEGIDQCVQLGATSIVMIPILLLEAGHAKYDLPEALNRAKEKYPHITFTYDKPFGVHDLMTEIIIKRMKEQDEITETSSVLIVARGSSDDSIRKDFEQIISRLHQKIKVQKIDVCYLAALSPNLEDGLAKHMNNDKHTVFVVPYLLFNGLLMQHIEKEIDAFPIVNKRLLLCNQLGLSDEITKLLLNKIANNLSEGAKQIDLSATYDSVTA